VVIPVVGCLYEERKRGRLQLLDDIAECLPKWSSYIDASFACEAHGEHLTVGAIHPESILEIFVLLVELEDLTEDHELTIVVALALVGEPLSRCSFDLDADSGSLWQALNLFLDIFILHAR